MLETFFMNWLVMSFLMMFLWSLYLTGIYIAWVDVLWCSGIALLSSAYFVFNTDMQGRAILVLSCVLFWAFRLAIYLSQRIKSSGDDPRYVNLEIKWSGRSKGLMLGLFLLQAFWCTTFAFVPILAMSNDLELTWVDALGLTIFVISILGEALSDEQLKRFKQNSMNPDEVCHQGLWSWSRHPNYFFEWLHWWSYVCFAYGSPYFYISFVGPVFMLYLIVKVTGIPPTEERLLKSRPEAYEKYQKRTSAFFPWPPTIKGVT